MAEEIGLTMNTDELIRVDSTVWSYALALKNQSKELRRIVKSIGQAWVNDDRTAFDAQFDEAYQELKDALKALDTYEEQLSLAVRAYVGLEADVLVDVRKVVESSS